MKANIKIISLFFLVLLMSNQRTLSDQAKKPGTHIFFELKSHHREFKPVINWLEKSEWCWGIELPHFSSKETIKMIDEKGFQILLHLHGHPEVLKRHWNYKKQPIPDVNEVIKKFVSALDNDAEKLIWQILIENDSSGVGHPHDLLKADPKTHSRAYELFQNHMKKVMNTASDFPKVKKWGLAGFASGPHPYAKAGLDCIILERANDDVEGLQTGLAFTRGAARQYDTQWGIDLSLWWGPIYGCVQDLPASYHKRHLYLSYYAGASTYRIEGGNLFYNTSEKRFNKLAEIVDDFGKFTIENKPGKPEIPAAVIIPEKSGWMTPAYWRTRKAAWNYARIPYKQGQKGIDGFFGYVFPGSQFAQEPFPFGKYRKDDPPASPFALSCVTPYFAPEPNDVFYAEPPIPFGKYDSRDTARKDMYENNTDPSPYRPMGDSRFGQIFDVFTDNLDTSLLKNYKAVVLLGPVNLDEKLKKELKQYVSNGGILIASAGVFTPQHKDITGLEIKPEFRLARAWKYKNGQYNHEAFHCLPSWVIDEKKSDILCKSAADLPLIVKTEFGKGNVYTCTIPWFEGVNRNLAGPAASLFDEIFKQIQPADIRGLPVQWLSSAIGEEKIIVISNNNSVKWQGSIILDNKIKKFNNCRELLQGKEVNLKKQNKKIKAAVELKPYEIGVFKFTE